MFASDKPIFTQEQDLLGRDEFASRLASAVLDWKEEDSLVIALYGPWGSGKTSLLNLVVEKLDEHNEDNNKKKTQKAIVFRFNPWNFTGTDHLLLMFFDQLLAQIGGRIPNFLDSVKDKLPQYGRLLSMSTSFFTKLLKQAPLGDIAGDVLEKGVELLQSIETDKTVSDLRKEIDSAFRTLDGRVIIILDDIDRLTQAEIRQVCQLIKLNADFPNTTYVLAADRLVVEKALDSEQGISGRRYLEKIVQVGFDIPPVEHLKITDYLTKELNRVFEKHPTVQVDQDRLSDLYRAGFHALFTTFRDVKRYINSLEFNHSIVAEEVDAVDFSGLEAIRVFMPEVYSDIADNRILFTQTYERNEYDPLGTKRPAKDALRAELDTIFAKAEGRQGIARAICRVLFPQISDAFEESITIWGRSFGGWRQARRVCAYDIFPVYFLLGIPTGSISQQELNLIASDLNRMDFAQSLARLDLYRSERTQLSTLLTRLSDVLKSLTEKGATNLAQVLLHLGDNEPNYRQGAFDLGTDFALLLLLLELIEKANVTNREKWLTDTVSESDSLPTLVHLTVQLSRTLNDPADTPPVNADCIKELRHICVSRAQAAAESEKLFSYKDVRTILAEWRKWSQDGADFDAFLNDLVNDVDQSIAFLKLFLTQDFAFSALGDITAPWSIDDEALSQIVEPIRFSAIFETIEESKEPLTEVQSRILSCFKELLLKTSAPKPGTN